MLKIASYNVANLNVRDKERLKEIEDQIVYKLGCPSVVGLVEIEDDEIESCESDELLDSLCKDLNARCSVKYKYSYISPKNGRDGGKLGSNIKQAILYDSFLFFNISKRGRCSDMYQTGFHCNPCRIGNCAVFKATRKPLIAKLRFRADPLQSIVVIVNHFKSENTYTDRDRMGSTPSQLRQGQAEMVAMFTKKFKYVVCMGDFNDVPDSRAYEIIVDNSYLKDTHADLPDHHNYTYKYKGKRMKLDYIFASPALMSCFENSDVLHLNANKNRMFQASDHDPVVAEFDLNKLLSS